MNPWIDIKGMDRYTVLRRLEDNFVVEDVILS